jgi:hypothetical protein
MQLDLERSFRSSQRLLQKTSGSPHEQLCRELQSCLSGEVWVAAAKIGPSGDAGVVSVISQLEPVHEGAGMTTASTVVICVRGLAERERKLVAGRWSGNEAGGEGGEGRGRGAEGSGFVCVSVCLCVCVCASMLCCAAIGHMYVRAVSVQVLRWPGTRGRRLG